MFLGASVAVLPSRSLARRTVGWATLARSPTARPRTVARLRLVVRSRRLPLRLPANLWCNGRPPLARLYNIIFYIIATYRIFIRRLAKNLFERADSSPHPTSEESPHSTRDPQINGTYLRTRETCSRIKIIKITKSILTPPPTRGFQVHQPTGGRGKHQQPSSIL